MNIIEESKNISDPIEKEVFIFEACTDKTYFVRLKNHLLIKEGVDFLAWSVNGVPKLF